MNKEQKAALVQELAGDLKGAGALFAVDYRGITVPQAAELRKELGDADTRFRIVKNRLTLRAAEVAGVEELKAFLEGPTAIAFVNGDAALAAKTIFRLGNEWQVLTYKGGLMEGESLDPDSFTQIARLPGREQMNAQLAGIVASPLTGLVRGLGSMVQGLAIQLEQIREQGLVSGETPTPDTDSGEAPPPEPDSSASGTTTDSSETPTSGLADESAPESAPDSEAESGSNEQAEEGQAEDKTEPEADPADPGREAEESAGNDDKEE